MLILVVDDLDDLTGDDTADSSVARVVVSLLFGIDLHLLDGQRCRHDDLGEGGWHWSDGGGSGTGGRVGHTKLVVCHGERVHGSHLSSELSQAGSMSGVQSEEGFEDPVGGLGNGQDGPEEVGVVNKGPESLVRGTSLSPWVSTTGQVDKNDAE